MGHFDDVKEREVRLCNFGRCRSTLTITVRQALGGERLWFYGQNTLLPLVLVVQMVQKQALSLSFYISFSFIFKNYRCRAKSTLVLVSIL